MQEEELQLFGLNLVIFPKNQNFGIFNLLKNIILVKTFMRCINLTQKSQLIPKLKAIRIKENATFKFFFNMTEFSPLVTMLTVCT